VPHRFLCRVYYEDTDLAGIVYYANYLKFIERARTEALIGLGIDQAVLRAEAGIVFAVARVAVEYRAPGRFQDRLTVTTVAEHVGGARVDLRQRVWRAHEELIDARVRIVALGPGGRAVRLPADVRAALAHLVVAP
jgi:acyl-CoA thioester hydrolase